MQTNIARADDYDQPRAAGNTCTAILIVDDDTTARLTISAMIPNEDEYRVTRLDNPRVRADLLNAGADAIAAKPINAPELRATVYAAARTRRQYRNLMREGS
jgi:CheY-like chemotaxis protein